MLWFLRQRTASFCRCTSSACGNYGWLFRLVVGTACYLGIGCIFYVSVEEKNCEGNMDVDCSESWTFVDALYFSVATISTCGYGDLRAGSDASKLFTMCYIFFGIIFVFSEVSQAIEGGLEGLEFKFLKLLEQFDYAHGGHAHISGRGFGFGGRKIDLSGRGYVDFIAPPGALVFWTQRLSPWVFLALLCQTLSASIFCSLEPGLEFFDAFYHSFTTATTVGYGDVDLLTQRARGFAVFHIIFSVTFFAALAGRVEELATIRKYELKRQVALERELDEDWVASIVEDFDMDQNGVDKLEFVIGMLTKFGVEVCGEPLTWKDIKPILVQFEIADKTHDGRLTKEDLRKLTQAKRAAALAGRTWREGARESKLERMNAIVTSPLSMFRRGFRRPNSGATVEVLSSSPAHSPAATFTPVEPITRAITEGGVPSVSSIDFLKSARMDASRD